jgi:hypothetical protein
MVPASFVSAEVRTPARVAVVNVTPEVRRALTEAGLRDGLALVSVPHTTCALCVNEDEAGLREDLARLAGSLVAGIEPAASRTIGSTTTPGRTCSPPWRGPASRCRCAAAGWRWAPGRASF